MSYQRRHHKRDRTDSLKDNVTGVTAAFALMATPNPVTATEQPQKASNAQGAAELGQGRQGTERSDAAAREAASRRRPLVMEPTHPHKKEPERPEPFEHQHHTEVRGSKDVIDRIEGDAKVRRDQGGDRDRRIPPPPSPNAVARSTREGRVPDK